MLFKDFWCLWKTKYVWTSFYIFFSAGQIYENITKQKIPQKQFPKMCSLTGNSYFPVIQAVKRTQKYFLHSQ